MTLTARKEAGIIASLFIVQFANVLDFMVIMPLGPVFMREFAISPSQFSWLVSVYVFASSISGFLAAAVMDRFDRRTLFLALLVSFVAANFACAGSYTFPILLFTRMLAGIVGGLLEAATYTIIGDAIPVERRGTVTGKIIAAFSLASLAGVPLGLYIENQFGWQATFVGLGLLSAAALAIAFLSMPSLTLHLGKKVEKNSDAFFTRIWRLITAPQHLSCLLFIMTIMMGVFLILPFIGSALVLNSGVPEESLHIVYMAGGAASIITTPLAGKFIDRYGRWSLFIILTPLSAIAMFTVMNLPTVSLTSAALMIAALMSLNGGRSVIANTLINDAITPELRGGFMSVKSCFQYLAGGLASIVGGLLISTGSDGQLQGLPLLGVLSALLTIASIPFGYRIVQGRREVVAAEKL